MYLTATLNLVIVKERKIKRYRCGILQDDKLAKQYDKHVDLICDLFYELTRAANYVCDQVRECLFQGYRLNEGVLLVERVNVGFDLMSTIARPEYRGKERTRTPYPGLPKFKKIRYKRDFTLCPNPPELPSELEQDE